MRPGEQYLIDFSVDILNHAQLHLKNLIGWRDTQGTLTSLPASAAVFYCAVSSKDGVDMAALPRYIGDLIMDVRRKVGERQMQLECD